MGKGIDNILEFLVTASWCALLVGSLLILCKMLYAATASLIWGG